jgi:hypothetical protein
MRSVGWHGVNIHQLRAANCLRCAGQSALTFMRMPDRPQSQMALKTISIDAATHELRPDKTRISSLA